MSTRVKIPTRAQRHPIPQPDDCRFTGIDLIKKQTYTICNALPDSQDGTLPATKPSSFEGYGAKIMAKGEKFVITQARYGEEPDSLQLPESFLAINWLEQQQWPNVFPMSSFQEYSIGEATHVCQSILATVVTKQLAFRKKGVAPLLSISPYHPLDTTQHRAYSTVGFEHLRVASAGNKTTLSLYESPWNEFPFESPECHSKPMTTLREKSRQILEQVIYYSTPSQVTDGKALAILALPPVRLHYILIDFEASCVTVFPNTIRYIPSSLSNWDPGESFDGSPIVDPNAWDAYWKTLLWFYFVVIAFHFKPQMDAIIEANHDLDADKKQLPHDFEEKINEAVAFLGERPPLNLRVRLSIWCILWTHRLMMLFICPVHAFWITLMWQALGTTTVMQTTQYLNIPQRRRLDLRIDSSLRYFWCPATLPDSVESWSTCGTKCFYVYPELKLFVKIFYNAWSKFETEVKIFNRLSEIQGKGIPVLYGSGKVADRDEFYLVMSYEGEPLEEWDEAARSQVEKLVGLLHRHHVHHHDIARRNIMVDKSGKFTLVDFERSEEGCECTEDEDQGFPKGFEQEYPS